MHAADVVMYGDRWFLAQLDGLGHEHWETSGVCGTWSVREIVAHLASYERLLVDILASLQGERDVPTLEAYLTTGAAFNDDEVARRARNSPAEVLSEYNAAHEAAARLLGEVPKSKVVETGVLEWYGVEYDLDDYLTYAFYGHKREHGAQIAVYRDRAGV